MDDDIEFSVEVETVSINKLSGNYYLIRLCFHVINVIVHSDYQILEEEEPSAGIYRTTSESSQPVNGYELSIGQNGGQFVGSAIYVNKTTPPGAVEPGSSGIPPTGNNPTGLATRKDDEKVLSS